MVSLTLLLGVDAVFDMIQPGANALGNCAATAMLGMKKDLTLQIIHGVDKMQG